MLLLGRLVQLALALDRLIIPLLGLGIAGPVFQGAVDQLAEAGRIVRIGAGGFHQTADFIAKVGREALRTPRAAASSAPRSGFLASSAVAREARQRPAKRKCDQWATAPGFAAGASSN
jgi:hypothetical protein